jgi:hypothetical protein
MQLVVQQIERKDEVTSTNESEASRAEFDVKGKGRAV